MGNCMKKTQQVEEEEEEIGEAGEKENEGKKGSSIKVKIVLTKEELELLLVKLKNNNTSNGWKSLEEVLGEIEKARLVKAESCWRPSLESIMEEDDVIDS